MHVSKIRIASLQYRLSIINPVRKRKYRLFKAGINLGKETMPVKVYERPDGNRFSQEQQNHAEIYQNQ